MNKQSDTAKSLWSVEDRLRIALSGIMAWRAMVNANPSAYIFDGDTDGVACALFNGPVWDNAERALKNGK